MRYQQKYTDLPFISILAKQNLFIYISSHEEVHHLVYTLMETKIATH